MDRIEYLLSKIAILVEDKSLDTIATDKQWIDSIAVMEYLNISKSTFYRLKKEGTIISRKIGKRSYYFKSDLIKAMTDSIKKGRL